MNRRTENMYTRWGNESWRQHNDLSNEVENNTNTLQLSKQRDENLSNDLSNRLPRVVKKLKDTIHVMNNSSDGSTVSCGARSRLLRDLYRLQCYPPSGVSGAPIDTDIRRWQGIIFGPDGSPWEGGIFKLGLTFDENYPFTAPYVRFLTKVFHPNVGPSGEISLGILGDNWNPVYDVLAILLSIQSLLCEPNPTCTAGLEASLLFSENKLEYNRRIKETVERSWGHES